MQNKYNKTKAKASRQSRRQQINPTTNVFRHNHSFQIHSKSHRPNAKQQKLSHNCKRRRNIKNHNNYTKESNLSKFWRQCRERDLRKKRRQHRNQSTQIDFKATIEKLKSDATILTKRCLNKPNTTNNQRHHQSMFFNNNSEISKENVNPYSRRFSNIFSQQSSKNMKQSNKKHQENQNSKILFHNKNYSSLQNQYNQYLKKSNICNLYNYFDSSQNDENTLKNRLQTKWKELKNDVDKAFVNYFNKKKTKKTMKEREKDFYTFSSTTKPGLNYFEQNNTFYKKKQTKNIYQNHNHVNINIKNVNNDDINNNKVMDDNKEKEEHKEESKTTDTNESYEKFQQNCNNENIENASKLSSYHLSNLQKSNDYWDFSVREIKEKLSNMNISYDGCIEKRDLVGKLKNGNNSNNNSNSINKNPPRQFPKKSESVPVQNKCHSKISTKLFQNELNNAMDDGNMESKEETVERVDKWIHKWSYRRSFRQLLNSILGYKSSDLHYINRCGGSHQDYALMMKHYKKAIMLIHPDKHVNSSFEIKYKSAEMFKIVTNLCDKYRQRYARKMNERI